IDQKPGPLNPKQREYLGDILSSGRHLLHLINDILDLAKVEAGRMEFAPETFSIGQTIGEVCAIIAPAAQKKNISVVTKVDAAVPEVTLDQQKFKQVLYNLLSNAIKFTGEGGGVHIAAGPCDGDRFSLQVADTGIGIKPEDLRRLFIEFEQLDSSAGRRYEGTGLGLVLTKKIVELQSGNIRVESEFGKGSTFTVVMPVKVRR
ncbi:MAG TPA: ATP-binding protein, partial [Blastocatellia bacterium]|nr:ATP-binding protein [Blastocatellia bacterium]